MTRTAVVCIHCGGRIRWHWQLIFLHARCRPPVEEPAAEPVTPPAEEVRVRFVMPAQKPWFDDAARQLQAVLHQQREQALASLNRHYRRALAKKHQ
jgi:hypothetical protein